MQIRKARAQECVSRDLLTYQSWGNTLSADQYLERERILRSHPWAQSDQSNQSNQSKMTTWVLEDLSGQIVSSCETFRMQSTFQGQAGSTYGFASVYTEAKHRGRGFAGSLVDGVCKSLESCDPLTQSFILYSEVGESIYARQKFKAVDSAEWVFDRDDFKVQSPKVEYLNDSEVGFVIDQAFGEANVKGSMSDSELVVRPTESQINWHWEREKIYARALQRPAPLQHIAIAGRASVAWMAYFSSSRLYALVFKGGSPQENSALLHDGAELCRRLGLREISIWETPQVGDLSLVDSLRKAKLSYREDSIAMARLAQKFDTKENQLVWRNVPRAIWV